MKNLLQISVMMAVFAIITVSCDTNDDGSGYYKPAEYVLPKEFTLNANDITASSAEITYTPTDKGVGYVVLLTDEDPDPTSTQVNNGAYGKDEEFTNFIKFDVDGETTEVVKFEGLQNNTKYKAFGIHKSIDSFITEKPIKILFTTLK